MIVEDFVMLGKTVPEPVSDGRIFVCSAGYSAELKSLIRIYPLARHATPPRWSISRIPLERNPKDHREESWKLAGDRTVTNHERINNVVSIYDKVNGCERRTLLDDDRLWVDSIDEANNRRMSLALIQPKRTPQLSFDHNPNSPDSPQLKLFATGLDTPQGAKRFAYIPRLEFNDDKSKHRLMLRDWGCYELMRKHPTMTTNMASALSLGPDSVLLIGNFNSHRNRWLVISVLNIGAQQMSLLDGVA